MEPLYPFTDPKIEAAFCTFEKAQREILLRLRALIHQTAEQDGDIGSIVESLKWGQPSFDTKPRTGTPIRLGLVKSSPDHVALFTHCQSNVMAQARLHYEDHFSFDGNRALLIPLHAPLAEEAILHVIRIALRYRLQSPD